MSETNMILLRVLAIVIGFVLCSLVWLCMDPDLLDDIVELIEEKKTKRLSRKAIKNDTYMFKFIKKMIHAEKKNKKRSVKNVNNYIVAFLFVLKESRTYDDFYAYQKECIDRLDRMKNIIRNYYQDDTYKYTAGITLSCLSIVETNLLTRSLGSDWGKRVNKYLYNCLYIPVNKHDSDNPEEWVKKIRKKEIRPKKWCDLLLEDLKLLETYYGSYQFDKDGWIYFDK